MKHLTESQIRYYGFAPNTESGFTVFAVMTDGTETNRVDHATFNEAEHACLTANRGLSK